VAENLTHGAKFCLYSYVCSTYLKTKASSHYFAAAIGTLMLSTVPMLVWVSQSTVHCSGKHFNFLCWLQVITSHCTLHPLIKSLCCCCCVNVLQTKLANIFISIFGCDSFFITVSEPKKRKLFGHSFYSLAYYRSIPSSRMSFPQSLM
jgi:hypothetical protein